MQVDIEVVERSVIVLGSHSPLGMQRLSVQTSVVAWAGPLARVRHETGVRVPAMEAVDQPMHFVQFTPQQASRGVTPSRYATGLRSSVPRFGGFELPGDIGNL